MKVWELMAQLQGRDPSGEVVLTLSGHGFKYVACFDLSPPANRKVVIEADEEDMGASTQDRVADLEYQIQRLIAATMEAQCSCPPAGHTTGCWFPELQTVLEDYGR